MRYMVRSRKKLYIGWFIGKVLNWIYIQCVCMHAQSCLTLCDPMDSSPPGSSVHGIVQARILEWVAFSLSRGSSWPRDQTCISCAAGRFFTSKPPGKVIINIMYIIKLINFQFPELFGGGNWRQRIMTWVSSNMILSVRKSKYMH